MAFSSAKSVQNQKSILKFILSRFCRVSTFNRRYFPNFQVKHFTYVYWEAFYDGHLINKHQKQACKILIFHRNFQMVNFSKNVKYVKKFPILHHFNLQGVKNAMSS